MKLLIQILLVFLTIRFVFRLFTPVVIQRNRHPDFDSKSTDDEGDIKVDNIPSGNKKANSESNNKGEYIDYEEIK